MPTNAPASEHVMVIARRFASRTATHVVMIAIAVAMLAYFKRKRWL